MQFASRWVLAASLLAGITPVALAQSNASLADLQRDNAALRAETARLQASCATPNGAVAAEQRAGDLAFSVASLRAGAATGYADGHAAVTVAVRIRNAGTRPITLDYNQRSFGLVDDHGYEYKLDNEESEVYFARSVKGIGLATHNRASVDTVLAPGQSQTVTFIAIRYMRDGQTVGNQFDLNATFGQYDDLGEGRIRHVRDFPVAFGDVPRVMGAQAAGASARDAANGFFEELRRGLTGH